MNECGDGERILALSPIAVMIIAGLLAVMIAVFLGGLGFSSASFERMVAMRYLRSRRREGFISVIAWFSLLGIALGVGTLIVVMSVMNGFREELLGRILGLNGHLNISQFSTALSNYDDVANKLRQQPGVISATPLVEGQVMATANRVASGAVVRGMSLEDLGQKEIIAANIIRGSIEDLSGPGSVMIGSRMAGRMGLTLGDTITLVSPTGSRATVIGSIPRSRGYTVGAIFEVGMYEYDNSFVFSDIKTAQLLFDRGSTATNIEVFVKRADEAAYYRGQLRNALGPEFRVVNWQRANASFFNALQVERTVMFMILTLIIVVAAFNIISSLIMLVKDKGRDIAILRTMGATRGMIMRIFFLSGASVGVLGTIIGVILGVTFALNIEAIRQFIQSFAGVQLFDPVVYFLSKLPAVVNWDEVALVVVMGLGLSFLATIYPSWRAARLDPVEALRYE